LDLIHAKGVGIFTGKHVLVIDGKNNNIDEKKEKHKLKRNNAELHAECNCVLVPRSKRRTHRRRKD
jgi:hypothetical protein